MNLRLFEEPYEKNCTVGSCASRPWSLKVAFTDNSWCYVDLEECAPAGGFPIAHHMRWCHSIDFGLDVVIGSLGLQESFYAKVDQNSRTLGTAGPSSKTVCLFMQAVKSYFWGMSSLSKSHQTCGSGNAAQDFWNLVLWLGSIHIPCIHWLQQLTLYSAALALVQSGCIFTFMPWFPF